MGRYIIRRALQAIPLLLLLSIFMFLLIHALPGGPEQVIFNPHLDAAGRAALRVRFGLDQPLYLQYLKWLGNCLTGDFGYSFATNQAVSAVIGHLLHLVLPVTALSVLFVAGWSRYIRSSMIDTTKQDYMRTARAKGVTPTSSLVRHALRNAVIPLITVVAIDFGAIAGGATITEGIFAWPGMGTLFLDSLQSRDYPVLLAILLLSGFFVVLFNLIADVLYGVMDPRIRYS